MSMLLLLNLFDVLIEPVEVLVPELLEAADPLVDRLETARVEAIETLLPVLADPDQSNFAQHAQVLRGARLRDPKCVRQVVDRSLARLQEHEDLPPRWFGDGVERVGGGRSPGHGWTLHVHMGICQSTQGGPGRTTPA